MTQDLLSTPAVAISDLNNPAQITQNNNQNTESSFSTIIDEAMLSQEFKGALSKTLSELGKVNASSIDESIRQTNTNLLHTFKTDLASIDKMKSFENISDANERTKAQLNFTLLNLSEKIDSLSPQENDMQ